MKRIIIVGVVIFVVVAYLVTYRVRFTETAVVTTVGKATDEPETDPGLHFIVPYVQKVVKYDSRARYLESRPETIQTKDAQQVVVTTYVTWRVSNPNLFFQKFSNGGERAINHYRGAEQMLSNKLRSAMGELSTYRFDELLSNSAAASRMEECEAKILKHIGDEGSAESVEKMYGIQTLTVGIIGMELPEETTNRVFDRMQQNRARIANEAISQGNAIAETIRNTAENDARTILDFADRRAQRIRGEGEREAIKFQEQLSKEPQLAVFIRNMELMKNTFANNRATILVPTGPNGWPGFEIFQPTFIEQLKSGGLKGFDSNRVPGASDVQPASTPVQPKKKEELHADGSKAEGGNR